MGTLQGVEDTLYIPLTARIHISKRFPHFFYDERALSLEKELPDDSIEKNSSEYFYMASVCRYRVSDTMILNFISRYKNSNVVNLGAGLETAYFRLQPHTAHFYEIDLPDVIETRKKVLGESETETLIKGDLFDVSWASKIDKTAPTIITALGVFQYFDENRICNLITSIKKLFSHAELVFDAMNSKAINYANKYVKKTGNKEARMHFWVDNPETFATQCNIQLVEQRPFFSDARKLLKKQLSLYTRIAMKVVDEGARRGYILRFNW